MARASSHITLSLITWIAVGALAGCNRQAQPPAVPTRPADEARSVEEPAPSPAPTTGTVPPVATAPATAPAATMPTQPSLPPSTAETTPPYRVELHIRSPKDKQPGWLKIMELSNEDASAAAMGIFPEQNRINIDTENVRRIRIELGYLPLAEGKRVVLRIDNQPREIVSRDRKFVTMERRPTGEWSVVPDKD